MDVGSAQRLLREAGTPHASRPRGHGGRGRARASAAAAGRTARLRAEALDAAAQLTAAFSLNLTALSLLALVVGMFLIYNTVMFTVVQRRAVIATLRALGATPAQMLGVILLEACAAGALGPCSASPAAGCSGRARPPGHAHDQRPLLRRPRREAPLTPWSMAKGAALGIGAALSPRSLRGSRRRVWSPRSACAPHAGVRAQRLAPRVALAGLALACWAPGCCWACPRSLVASFAALFAIVVGLALLVPWATVVRCACSAPLVGALAGTLGRLAARTVTRAVSRTGVAIAALMVAVSVTIGVGLMIRSFRQTVENWLDLSLRADVYIAARRAAHRDAGRPLAGDPGARERSARRRGGRALSLRRGASPDGDVSLAVADPQRERDAALYRFSSGSPQETWARVRAGAVLVSEPFAFRRRLPPHGGSVTLQTDRGAVAFPVAGVFYDYASEQGWS